ncbi:MAG: hypothetical protein LBP88_01525 [Treponema sp.]|jgi:hypothetical protein|nr:hypothetical protein [Treponema sp.]
MVKLTLYFVRKKGISLRRFRKTFKEYSIKFASLTAIQENVISFVISNKVRIKIPGLLFGIYDGIWELKFNENNPMSKTFSNIECIKKVKPFDQEFIELEKCNYIISNEYPNVFSENNNKPHLQKVAKIRFTTLLIKNNNFTFDEFVNYHKENHIPLFSSIPIIKKYYSLCSLTYTIRCYFWITTEEIRWNC